MTLDYKNRELVEKAVKDSIEIGSITNELRMYLIQMYVIHSMSLVFYKELNKEDKEVCIWSFFRKFQEKLDLRVYSIMDIADYNILNDVIKTLLIHIQRNFNYEKIAYVKQTREWSIGNLLD